MQMMASLVCGLVFGAGLLISGMVQPAKVLGFLDIFGAWDPSLAVGMIAALAVTVPGFLLARGPAHAAVPGRAKFRADQDADRPAAGAGGSPVRRRLGARWTLPGPGAGEP